MKWTFFKLDILGYMFKLLMYTGELGPFHQIFKDLSSSNPNRVKTSKC